MSLLSYLGLSNSIYFLTGIKIGQIGPFKYRKKHWSKNVFDSKIIWNRNGKLFIEITEDNYETCGITTLIIDGDDTVRDSSVGFVWFTDSTVDGFYCLIPVQGRYMSYSGHVWSNIEHAIISRPKPLFNFQCVHLFSGFTFQPPSIGEIGMVHIIWFIKWFIWSTDWFMSRLEPKKTMTKRSYQKLFVMWLKKFKSNFSYLLQERIIGKTQLIHRLRIKV